MPAIAFLPGRWYVMDRFASSVEKAYVAGPFISREEAETDRLERNIADDCASWQAPDSRFGSSIPAVLADYALSRGYSGLPAISGTFTAADGWRRADLRPTLNMAALALCQQLGITSVSVVWGDSSPADFQVSELTPTVGLQGCGTGAPVTPLELGLRSVLQVVRETGRSAHPRADQRVSDVVMSVAITLGLNPVELQAKVSG